MQGVRRFERRRIEQVLDGFARRPFSGRTRRGHLAHFDRARRRNWFYDWAGGLVWLAVAPAPDCHEKAVRTAVNTTGGHATLIRAPEAARAALPVFHPQPPALATLSARVKTSFDPERILNRGRMRDDL